MGFSGDISWHSKTRGPLPSPSLGKGTHCTPPNASHLQVQTTREPPANIQNPKMPNVGMARSKNGRRDKDHSAQTTGPFGWSKRTGFGTPLLTVKEDEAHSQIGTQNLTPPAPIGMGWQAASFAAAPTSGQKFGRANGRNRQTVFDMNRPVLQPSNHTEMLLKHEFHRGMLISAPLFHEDRDQGKSRAPSNHRSIAAHGIVYGKPRYMIIVGFHFDHYICVPIYTFEKKGITGREHYAQEFISIRDGKIPENKFRNQCDYDELVTDGKGSSLHPLSLAYISHTVPRSYDLNIKCHGALEPESLERLLGYVKHQSDKALGLRLG